MKDRVILHCDLNNFYASVELLERQDLKEKPVAVCGSVEERHGIVLAKNDIAKHFGIKTAQTVWQAQQLCPELVILDAHFKKYQKYSEIVRSILYRYTDIIEPFGPDESWMDVTNSVSLFGSGEAIAKQIKEEIKTETGLTVSIGVSFNKIFAKLGSDYKKPDAITVISRENFKAVVYPLAANEMIGIGKNTYAKLKRLGIQTIGDLADSDIRALKKEIGIVGERLWYYAMGLDMSPVIAQKDLPEAKSISRSTTTAQDLENNEDVWKSFLVLAEDISAQMFDENFLALKLGIMIRDESLHWESFSEKLETPICYSLDIARKAMKLFIESYGWKSNIRSIGIAVSDFIDVATPMQLTFDIHKQAESSKKNDYLMMLLKDKFGKNAIKKATVVDFGIKTNENKNFSRQQDSEIS